MVEQRTFGVIHIASYSTGCRTSLNLRAPLTPIKSNTSLDCSCLLSKPATFLPRFGITVASRARGVVSYVGCPKGTHRESWGFPGELTPSTQVLCRQLAQPASLPLDSSACLFSFLRPPARIRGSFAFLQKSITYPAFDVSSLAVLVNGRYNWVSRFY
jgi:hypothetical protein